jgi:hypothetical protein
MNTALRRAALAAIGGIALIIAMAVSVAPANAAGPAAAPTRHCVTVLGSLDADTGLSTVVSRTCGAQAATVTPQASTHLVDIFYDINYGRFLDSFYGNFGTCDASGYHIGLPTFDGSNISSLTGYGACNRANITNRQGNTETVVLPCPWIGSAYNDNVSAIRPFHG